MEYELKTAESDSSDINTLYSKKNPATLTL